ncbi:hypothetical protein [Kitasatospora sp. DSM 101779]|uniref:hypothetical protein n=1 Tax=Kitasatospora sp. DSM 101779 TaxID=2853165 RepID=UPI0021D8C755|nr:hypothetical protein [Kitasatospora sp. DSM 101779]MCU7826395.1 hypothetical protein [Kitasatospora sp. DSM 101779]
MAAGCTTDQGRFCGLFDHIVLLSAPAEVPPARIAARTDNPSGKRPEERDAVLHHPATLGPLLRATATAELDATAPLERLVQRLEELAGR